MTKHTLCDLEYCLDCGELTGRAGRADDSLFIDDDGPYCKECFDAKELKAEMDNDANYEHAITTTGEGW